MVVYKCLYCGKKFTPEDLANLPHFMCPQCTKKIILKERARIPKTVKAI